MDLITVTPARYSEGEYITAYKDGVVTTSLIFPGEVTEVRHIKDRYFLLVFAVDGGFRMYVLDMDGLERTMPPPTTVIDVKDPPSYLLAFTEIVQAVAAHGAELLYLDSEGVTHYLDLITGDDTIVPNPGTDDIVFGGDLKSLRYVKEGIERVWKGHDIKVEDRTLRVSDLEYRLPFPVEEIFLYEGVGSYGSAVRGPDKIGVFSRDKEVLILNLTATKIEEAERFSIPRHEEILSLNHAGILTRDGEYVIIRTPLGKTLKYKARLAALGDFRLKEPVIQGRRIIIKELPQEGVTGWDLDT